MLYDAVANTHDLAIDSFKALVAPRSIGWISKLGKNGIVNLAAYSFFNAVSEDPHFLMFGADGRKDSQRNAEETGEFRLLARHLRAAQGDKPHLCPSCSRR